MQGLIGVTEGAQEDAPARKQDVKEQEMKEAQYEESTI
jgi:hypothetical protein